MLTGPAALAIVCFFLTRFVPCRLLAGRLCQPRNGSHNDRAHPPIHPTKAATGDINAQARKVYEFITRRFLACVSDDARGEQKTVEIEIGKETFSASGLVVTERNFLDVYPYWTWKNQAMAPFAEGETFIPDHFSIESGSTTAPHHLTEAELITLMDKNGIGTDATIHEHIAKVQEREYIYKHQEFFVPSTMGVALVEAYSSMGYELSKPHLRAKMEADMKRICDGSMTREQVVSEAVALYSRIFEDAANRRMMLVDAVSKYFNVPPLDGGGAQASFDGPPDDHDVPPGPPPTSFNPLIRSRSGPQHAAAAPAAAPPAVARAPPREDEVDMDDPDLIVLSDDDDVYARPAQPAAPTRGPAPPAPPARPWAPPPADARPIAPPAASARPFAPTAGRPAPASPPRPTGQPFPPTEQFSPGRVVPVPRSFDHLQTPLPGLLGAGEEDIMSDFGSFGGGDSVRMYIIPAVLLMLA